MNKINVIINNDRGTAKNEAELCLETGIIKFTNSEMGFSHISAVASRGMIVIEKPVEIIKEVKVIEVPITPVRSEKPKKKKSKG